MSSSNNIEFTKDNIDLYLKELSKEYRKRSGKDMRAEIILVGGASVLINYGFRQMTTDVDAMYEAASSMKDAIGFVANKYDLPSDWLNTNFIKTESYTNKLRSFAKKYKTYSNIVDFYTVDAEYLVAMKLRSGREYKNDLSDIIGILAEHHKHNNEISLHNIKNAARDLYGSWEKIPENSRQFIENAYKKGEFEETYNSIKKQEELNKNVLLEFEDKYPRAVNTSNINEILEKLKSQIK